MRFIGLLAALLFKVATSAPSRCRLDASCAAGLTIVELDICAFTDEDVDDLAACFDNVGRSNIEFLNLRRNALVNLPVGFFDGFDALAELNMEFNRLDPQAGTFEGASSLATLNLARNNIDFLPNGFFQGIESLRELNLDSNGIVLAAGDFINATSLEVLIYNTSAVESLPSGIFEGLGTLLELSISNNRISTFPADVFDDVPNLLRLDFSDNYIASLPADTFSKLTSLQELKTSRNAFDTWPANFLDGLSSLTTLYLDGHRLRALEAGSFKGTPALEFLSLTTNSLTTLPAGSFDGIDGSLRVLRLQFNDLTAIPANIFVDFPLLRILDISANGLTTLQADDFEGATSLEELDMSSTFSGDLPAGIFEGMTSLRTLDLSGNGPLLLRADHFKGASSLETLSLAYCGLTALPSGVFSDLSSLTSLSLSSNSFTTLDEGTFEGTPSLESLNLRFNDLTSLPSTIFEGLSSLEELSLNNNEFTTLPTDMFDNLSSLLELFLDGNAISTLPAGLFDGLESLQELDVDDNDNLQCLPTTGAETIDLPDEFDDTTTCGCPEDPVCDEDGSACDCRAGINGYSCVGTSSALVRAFSCPTTGDCTSDAECTDDEVCCPTSQTCEPLLQGSSNACGDPHMTGFRGQKFDFTGDDGEWYALISDLPSLHLNMRVTAPVPEVPEITYITGIALLTVGADDVEHSIVISVNDPHSLDSACPSRMPACLADGALSVVIDGEDVLATPGTVSPGDGVSISAVNLPGACRSFGFEKYWGRKMLEDVRGGEGRRNKSQDTAKFMDDALPAPATEDMGEWILADPTATNMMECAVYVAESTDTDGGLFAHQSEHASFKISTPRATIRVSHGRLHQVEARDPTDKYDLPDHLTWQMNLAIDHYDISRHAKGVLGETIIPTVDASGNAIMNGMESIRGTQESYYVAGPFGVDFDANTIRT